MLNQFYLKFVFFFTRSLCSVLTKQKQKTHTLEVVQLTGQIRLAVVPSPYSFLPVTLPSSFFFFLHSFKVYLPHQGTELSVARTNHLFHLSVLFRVENSESLIRPFDQRPVAGDFYDPVNPASFSFLFAPFGAASVRR